MVAFSGNDNNEPWRISQKERELIRKNSNSDSESEKKIADYEKKLQWAWELTHNPGYLKQELAPLFEEMNKNKENDLQFAMAVGKLENFLGKLESRNGIIPPVEGNYIAAELLALCSIRRKISSFPINSLAKLISKYGSSSESISFILEILRGDQISLSKDVVSGLAWNRSIKGNDAIFEQLAKLYESGGKSDTQLLGVMSRLNANRALPKILEELAQTDDIRKFIRLSSGISEYNRPELLEPVLKKLKDFPRSPFGSGTNPTTGIYPEVLLRFIAMSDGDNLRLGLDALDQTAIALSKSYPLLLEKLGNSGAKSRVAVLKCLERAFIQGAFVNQAVLNDLNEKTAGENDPEVKSAKNAALNELRKRLKRK